MKKGREKTEQGSSTEAGGGDLCRMGGLQLERTHSYIIQQMGEVEREQPGPQLSNQNQREKKKGMRARGRGRVAKMNQKNLQRGKLYREAFVEVKKSRVET